MKKTLKLTVVASLFALGLSLQPQAIAAAPMLPELVSSGQLPSLSPMLKQVLPSVVNIQVKGKKTVNQGFQLPEEFLFMFPQLGRQQPQEFKALGSGVIIDAHEGLVVTNYHVIDSADDIKVSTSDGRQFDAEKIGGDEHTDLALLKLKEYDRLQAISLANSDELEVGDFAVAIGNPFGLGQTVTSGIISALGRSGLNIENIENFIQTDAAINSGNSGGALINLKGELIGINTAILGPNGGNIGIGFAIPVNMVKKITDQIVNYGEVKRGMLGVTGSELNADLASSFGYSQNSGAFVNEVMKDSAADKAGIKSGDIITSVNGKQIKSFAQLRAEIATQRPGSNVTLGIFRDGQESTLTVQLDESAKTIISADESSDLSPAFEGASLANNDDGGVLITEVAGNSMAARLGLKKDDVITAVNRSKVKDLHDLRKMLQKSKGKVSALRIKRGNSELYLTLR
ncbi:MAG: Do family serine endopeptidase [Succinivibrio sp.]|nr:Do family serine endopeptidase [Succinivibrio sp.]